MHGPDLEYMSTENQRETVFLRIILMWQINENPKKIEDNCSLQLMGDA